MYNTREYNPKVKKIQNTTYCLMQDDQISSTKIALENPGMPRRNSVGYWKKSGNQLEIDTRWIATGVR